MAMNAGDIMTKNPIALGADSTVRDVVNELLNADIRHVPILDQGAVIGMVSDRDIQGYALPLDMQLDDAAAANARLDSPVIEAMSGAVISVSPSSEIGEIIDIMLEERVGAVPVIDPEEGQLVGIVSYIDVLRAVREIE